MIGLLLIAHGTLGESLIHCASHVLGKRPLYVRQLGISIHDEPEAVLDQARDLLRFLDQGQGVLVLTDIFGATPSNIATQLLDAGKIEGISGVNLPMLIRALTYRESPMATLIEKAISGGHDGVMSMPHHSSTG